jgi:Reverse transcriptase (RNA-dependent DNA polymerase)
MWGTWVPSAQQMANLCHVVTPHPPVKHSCHATGLEEFDNPTLQQALSSSQKQQCIGAISEELESSLEGETWDAVSHAPPGKRVFPSKFVLKVKGNLDRTIERYKARLVLLWHVQRQNIDFFETYSPVVDFTAVRIALTIAYQEGKEFYHLDVKFAFLYGYLDEEIYMCLPQEYQSPDRSVCRLKRSIFGLKQAPRAWNARLTDDLQS